MATFRIQYLIWLLAVVENPVARVGASRPADMAEWSLAVAPLSFQHLQKRAGNNASKGENGAPLQAQARSAQAHEYLPVVSASLLSVQLETQGENWGEFKGWMKDVAIGFVSAVNDGVSVAQGAAADLPILVNALSNFRQAFNVSTVSDAIANNKIATILGAVPPAFMTIGALAGFSAALWELIDLMKEKLSHACECLNQLLRRKRVIAVIDFILAKMALLGDTNIQALLLAASGGAMAAAVPGLIILGGLSRLGALALKVFGVPYLLVWEDACQHACDDDGDLKDTSTPTTEEIAKMKKKGSYLDSAELVKTSQGMQSWKRGYVEAVRELTWDEYESKVMDELADTQNGVGGAQLNGTKSQRLSGSVNNQANLKLQSKWENGHVERHSEECVLWKGFHNGGKATIKAEDCTWYRRKCLGKKAGVDHHELDPDDPWYIDNCCDGCLKNCGTNRANWVAPPDCVNKAVDLD